MGRQLHTRRLLLTGPKRFSIKVDPTPNPTLRVPSSLTKDWSLGAESIDSDERYSPNWLIQLAIEVMGGIDLDPCADPLRRVPASNHFTKEQNGLDQHWAGRLWFNPPFSQSAIWVRQLGLYCLTGDVSQAMVLLPMRALTNKACRPFMRGIATGLVVIDREVELDHPEPGRSTKYKTLKSGAFALLYFGDRTSKFLDLAEPYGTPCLIRQRHKACRAVFCSYCQKPFIAKQSDAKFCGTTCRVEAHRKAKS